MLDNIYSVWNAWKFWWIRKEMHENAENGNKNVLRYSINACIGKDCNVLYGQHENMHEIARDWWLWCTSATLPEYVSISLSLHLCRFWSMSTWRRYRRWESSHNKRQTNNMNRYCWFILYCIFKSRLVFGRTCFHFIFFLFGVWYRLWNIENT